MSNKWKGVENCRASSLSFLRLPPWFTASSPASAPRPASAPKYQSRGIIGELHPRHGENIQWAETGRLWPGSPSLPVRPSAPSTGGSGSSSWASADTKGCGGNELQRRSGRISGGEKGHGAADQRGESRRRWRLQAHRAAGCPSWIRSKTRKCYFSLLRNLNFKTKKVCF